MFNEEIIVTILFLQIGLFWLLSGICLSRIIDHAPSMMIGKVWAWIPLLQIRVYAAAGHVSTWSIFWRAMLAAMVVEIIGMALIAVTVNVFVFVLSAILTNVAATYFVYYPMAKRAGFDNARTLSLLAGVPLIGPFVLVHIAWKGDWS